MTLESEVPHGSRTCWPPFYGAVSRDGLCVHIRFVHEPYFARVAARGVEFPQTLEKQPWGGTDFHVRDPDGKVFSFVTFE